MSRGGVSFAIKLAISAVLVVVLLRNIPLDTVIEALSDPNWKWLLAAIGVFALSAIGGRHWNPCPRLSRSTRTFDPWFPTNRISTKFARTRNSRPSARSPSRRTVPAAIASGLP